MNPITIPMMTKSSQPVLTAVLLAAVIAAFVCVCFLMARHEHRSRKRKKNDHGNHAGRHGNH